MYKEDLALNNLQCLICHKTQLNQNKDLYLTSLNIATVGKHATISHTKLYLTQVYK